MTELPASIVRPGRGRLTAIVLLGPLAGAIALVVAQAFFGTPAVSASEIAGMAAFFVGFSYILGLVSAILAAFIYWLVYPALARRSWPLLLGACLAIGILRSALACHVGMASFEQAGVSTACRAEGGSEAND